MIAAKPARKTKPPRMIPNNMALDMPDTIPYSAENIWINNIRESDTLLKGGNSKFVLSLSAKGLHFERASFILQTSVIYSHNLCKWEVGSRDGTYVYLKTTVQSTLVCQFLTGGNDLCSNDVLSRKEE